MGTPAATDELREIGDAVPGARRRYITFRAALIGLLLVAGLGLVTPYNDYVVYNTLTTGGYFPPVVALSIFVLVLVVNAPLYALRPRWALTSGELTVIMALLLVGACVPGQSLMRALLPSMVSPFHFARTDPAFSQVLPKLDLPWWLFPATSAGPGTFDARVVAEFYNRTPSEETPPYVRWILPLAVWGVFLTGMYVSMLSMASLLRAQWAHNERLAFPIAQLELELIRSPRPGRWVNDLIGSKGFWIACGGVILIHLINGLSAYFPRYVPAIPLTYNLNAVMTAPPWSNLNFYIKTSTLYFTIVGIMYFIPGRVGFSLWFIFLAIQGFSTAYQHGFERAIPAGAWNDQHIGAGIAFLLSVAWIGRGHWAMVTRHVFRGPGPGESGSYRTPALLLLAGNALMFAWLLVVGAGVSMSLLIIGCMFLVHLVVARIIAETGLPIFRSTINPVSIYTNFPATAFSGREVFYGSTFGLVGGAFATRESPPALALHSLRLADEQQPTQRERRLLMGLMGLSIAVAVVTSAASGLYSYYNYATPISTKVQQPVINDYLLLGLPRNEVIAPLNQHDSGAFAGKAHDPWFHIALGAAIQTGLQLGAWASASFPFAPVAYLVCTTWYLHQIWWSIFLGWLLKAIIVRWGGASLYREVKPIFVGLIFGESLAATMWLLVSFVSALSGYHDYEHIRLLPT